MSLFLPSLRSFQRDRNGSMSGPTPPGPPENVSGTIRTHKIMIMGLFARSVGEQLLMDYDWKKMHFYGRGPSARSRFFPFFEVDNLSFPCACVCTSCRVKKSIKQRKAIALERRKVVTVICSTNETRWIFPNLISHTPFVMRWSERSPFGKQMRSSSSTLTFPRCYGSFST